MRQSGWLTNVLLVYLFVVVQGWTADLVKGDKLFEWLGGGVQIGGNAGLVALALLGALSLCIATWLYQRRETFMPVRVFDLRREGPVTAKRFVVLALSSSGWTFDPNERQLMAPGGRGGEFLLPTTLMEALDGASRLQPRWSWEMLLRALAPHAHRLEQVFLLPSEQSCDEAASCVALLRDFFPRAEIEVLRPANFNDLDALLQAYESACTRARGRGSDLIIDVTGGSKLVSIAASLFTLQHPEVEFQYVVGAGDKGVLSFNVGVQRD